MAYFERTGPMAFLPTHHTAGAWNTREQHIAPSMGLLVHILERDCARRASDFVVGRLSYDILGPIPIEPVEVELQILRAGRSIELVEVTLSHHQRPALRLRAWLMQPRDTRPITGTPLDRIPPADTLPAWSPATVWPGAFIESVEIRRSPATPGRATYWARARHALLDDEPVSAFARAAGLFDIANGMAVRVDPREVGFPNLDLSAHLFGMPQGEWLGFDTRVSFGAQGIGLTSSILHDAGGPIGTVAQALTLRPQAAVATPPREPTST